MSFDPSEFENLRYKKSLRKFPFVMEIKDEDNESKLEVYALCEMDSASRDQFLDLMNKKMPGGRVQQVEGLQAELLIRSIRQVCNTDKKPIIIDSDDEIADITCNLDKYFLSTLTKKEVQAFPCTMQGEIFEKSMKLNALWDEDGQKKAKEQVKNS